MVSTTWRWAVFASASSQEGERHQHERHRPRRAWFGQAACVVGDAREPREGYRHRRDRGTSRGTQRPFSLTAAWIIRTIDPLARTVRR
jgi:hypothetical protein